MIQVYFYCNLGLLHFVVVVVVVQYIYCITGMAKTLKNHLEQISSRG